ncbi:MAG: M2 family metallopeptidase [Calditrichia bacterium]
MFLKKWNLLVVFLLAILLMQCTGDSKQMEKKLTKFIEQHVEKVKPLSRKANLAYFEATTSGKEDLYKQYEELQLELSKIYANKDDFEFLKKVKESGKITDPLLKRQLLVLYNEYLARQIDESQLKELIRRETELEKKYSTFRAKIDGKYYTDNQIEEILQTSRDNKMLEKAWKASKQIGVAVAEDVLKLVKIRNEIARKLGFQNYHQMKLALSEQDPQEIEKLFDELDELTRKTFFELKQDIDKFLAKRYGLKPEQLQPWHYQNRFFQEAPKIYPVDLDQFYKDKDVVKLTAEYFASIGLPIDDLIEKSDLFEREGKYQHAYCTDIDREGDVRVVCNVKPNYNWMNTMLHEYGHAVYDKFNNRNLPWLLREPAHTFTTEAIAMMFGRMAGNPAWIKDLAKVPAAKVDKVADACRKSQRLEQLTFSRWAQVMYRFEKAMYENPDQDLNALWWKLVEKYQGLKKPTNHNGQDWASKIHVALYPAYYHNYLMGELLASQLYFAIAKEVYNNPNPGFLSFYGNPEVGKFLREKVFKPGKQYHWNEMIRLATGEPLTARYYAKQFVGQ